MTRRQRITLARYERKQLTHLDERLQWLREQVEERVILLMQSVERERAGR